LLPIWSKLLRTRPRPQWREYKRKTKYQFDLKTKRNVLQLEAEELKSQLRSALEPKPSNEEQLQDRISDLQTRTILKDAMIDFLKQQIDEVIKSKSKLNSTLVNPELGMINDADISTSVPLEPQIGNEIVWKALKSHVQLEIYNSKNEKIVNDIRIKAVDFLASIDECEKERLRKSAYVRLFEFIESHREESVQTQISTMNLELEFCENNQKITEALENMKLITVRVGVVQRAIKESIQDCKRTLHYLLDLHSQVPTICKEARLILDQISPLLPTIDIMRMSKRQSLFHWNWDHDPLLSHLKVGLGLSSSMSFDSFCMYVKEQKDKQSQLFGIKKSVQSIFDILQKAAYRSKQDEEQAKGIFF
jgi:hypothetical protein